jgi:glycosyltransferase involved in cell wall biosynthesis
MSVRRLRVLLTTDAVGGVWSYSLDLARGLARLDIETVLAVMGPAASPAQKKAARAVPGLRLVDTGLPLDWLAPDAASLARSATALARLAAKEQVDLVQLHAPALAADTLYPVPVVAVVHSCVATWWDQVVGPDAPLPEGFVWRTDAARAGLAAADLVVTPTAAFGALVQRCYGLAEAPRTVHNGRTPLTGGHHAPHDFIFTAGRLWDKGKNLATLDAAAAGIGVPVHAAGPLQGPHGETVAFENLNCLGSLGETELARHLAARPVFASVAVYEPFGLAVLEAAAAGCALILADTPTFRELWDEIALFIDPYDTAALARACNELVADDFERAVMGRAAKERAAYLTPDAMAAQMANLYRGLLPALPRPVLAARAAA